MVQIGSTTLPGVQTTVESSSSVGVNIGSPADVAVAGQADLANGTANANEVKAVTTPVNARKYFGEKSPLTTACIDALSEGAYPVYAVAVAKNTVTGEDLSGMSSTSGTLANAPCEEDSSSFTFTIDGSTKSTVLTYGDPHATSPASGEVYVNPVTGEFELDAAPGDTSSTNDTVDYTYHNYTDAISEVETNYADKVDFLGACAENDSVTQTLLDTVNRLEGQYEFAIALAGSGTYVSDYTNVSTQADDSRLQEYFPLRNSDGECIIGSVLGKRAALGISASPMNKALSSQSDLRLNLSQSQQENLVTANINPIANVGSGSRIVDDLTTVSDSNTEEENFKQGISRLVTDLVTEEVHGISRSYVGELHTQSARNSLRGDITSVLKRLLGLNAITAFTITVEEVDAMTASVNVGIDTIDPLRNIVANITAGEVSGGVSGQ